MSNRDDLRTAIAEAIELATPDAGTPLPGRNGATAEMVDILSTQSLAAMLAAHQRGERGPVYVLCIPKYAPSGTEGWVYVLDKVNKVTVNLSPVGGGRGLKADPFGLALADADDLRNYRTLRDTLGESADLDLHTGAVVLLAGEGWNEDAAELYVITGLKGMTQMSAVRLGGDGGQSWPKLPRSLVKAVIAPEHLTLAMSADPRFKA